MFLLYIDESGVPNTHPSQTSHYVMIGMAVHVGTWFALSQRRASSGVQVADLCAYALRRYLENEEAELFSIIFPKFYRAGGGLSGLRHFTAPDCGCMICAEPKSARPRRPRKKRKKTWEVPAASRSERE